MSADVSDLSLVRRVQGGDKGAFDALVRDVLPVVSTGDDTFTGARPAESFDRVICTEVLEHTTNPEEILGELARLLRPDGRAVITVPNDKLIEGLKGVLRRTPAGWLLGGRVNWGGDEFHIHKWRPSEFRALLSRFFVVESQRAAPFDALPIRACFQCRKRA